MRTVAVDHSERPDEVSMNYARQNECSEVKKTIRLPRKHGERSLKTVIQGEENSEVYDPAENHPLSYLIDDYLVDTDPIELPASNPDWTFLQPVEGTAFPDCPSLASGSTVSSRNSSTRSTKSLRWHGSEYMLNGDAEPATGERCPMPDCNRVFKDLKCHLLTHRTERPEKCPVETCEYHVKGFARAYDRMRHTCTHFRGTMTCGFCADSGDTAQIHYNNVYVFSRHLTSVHKVTQVSAARRAQLLQRTTTANTVPQPSPHTPSATCTMCSEPFDAQGFYEHLLGCVLRQVTRDLVDVQENRLSTPTEASFHLSEPVTTALEQVVPRDEDSTECREIAELTASSRCLSLTSSSNEIGSSGEETDWTEDAGSPESEVDVTSVRPILSPVKQRLVDRIMTEFHRLFDQSHSNNRTHNGSNPSSSAYRPGISSSGSSTYSSASFISRKRSLSGGGSPPPNEDGDDTHKRRRPDSKLSNGKQPVPELRFACPYYKRNPGRHQTFTSCRDPGFITVARLKTSLSPTSPTDSMPPLLRDIYQ
ncbi:hypothetical protein BDV95DRAFT_268348 [Massariosphaeria phaeospora]|uniref:C2H2-type domain-containing protein n=1 Tax=Massariosphaeria phaeospora TaxID=100035 RepID=A0A7C8HYG2_9PLEO|nr:hypothetical protein BDV95DRAFT_268348 [Massariosphaeria phaeospora]